MHIRGWGHRFEKTLENTRLGPPAELAVPIPEVAGQITPRRPRSNAPEYSLKKQTIVFGCDPTIAGFAWQLLLKLRSQFIRNYEPILNHSNLGSRRVNQILKYMDPKCPRDLGSGPINLIDFVRPS